MWTDMGQGCRIYCGQNNIVEYAEYCGQGSLLRDVLCDVKPLRWMWRSEAHTWANMRLQHTQMCECEATRHTRERMQGCSIHMCECKATVSHTWTNVRIAYTCTWTNVIQQHIHMSECEPVAYTHERMWASSLHTWTNKSPPILVSKTCFRISILARWLADVAEQTCCQHSTAAKETFFKVGRFCERKNEIQMFRNPVVIGIDQVPVHIQMK